MQANIINNIFSLTNNAFDSLATEVFQFQYQHNKVYAKWCDLLKGQQSTVDRRPPFLPISFFKSHTITTTLFEPQQIFESSGTTQTINSKHLVKDITIYEQSFIKAFELFYGNINEWCIIGLLPSYLERNNSSLVMMVDALIKLSNHTDSGFYLNEFDKLTNTLQHLEAKQQKTLLIGVTFALLDFAENYAMPLQHTVVMETGGMKGRRKELTREEVHAIITNGLGVSKVHSEYGMTELLSQAYSKGDGRFICPPWMKVLVRDEEDPLNIKTRGKGVLNVIDLANIYSCSFIATEDVGVVHEDGSFEVWGRLDNSDIRGCSLLVV
ncbi:acyl transferase [Parasediminibacterium paludis]|uniref:Acyl transferase n=1 Tax=Parasediminibacterium paludis TaxID=908966 RepID=A0ABV8Q0C6_9BACT